MGLTNEVQGILLMPTATMLVQTLLVAKQWIQKAMMLFVKLGYWLTDDKRLELEVNKYRLKGRMNFTGVNGNRANGVPTSSIKSTPRGLAPYNDVQTTSLSYTDSDLDGMEFKAQVFHQDFEGRYGVSKSGSFQDPSNGITFDQSQNQSEKIGAKFSLTKDDLLDNDLKRHGRLRFVTRHNQSDVNID